ncbi:MAG: 2-phospho-L-lactate guanylyltransferase, partial [Humibacillus sp.]|nr:2-phospho-L-lactate guanylyltransferase [Humibacillus sp.]
MVAYVVLLPVKPPALGKSRIQGLPDARRRDLAEAFALDTA